MTKTDGQTLLQGVIPASLTPLSEDLRPDAGALIAHCRWLLAQGCHGVLVLGTTGEANSLGLGERLALMDALEEAGLGPRLLVGTGCCATADTARLTRRAVSLGAAGVMMLPPFYYKDVSDDGLFAYFAEVIQQVADARLRLYLYNIPRMAGVGLGPDLIERLLAEYPGVVVGMKDSSGDWPATAAALAAYPDFQLFPGSEEYLLPALLAGGPGCISATLNVLAPRALRVHAAWQTDEAGALQRELTRLRRLFAGKPYVPSLKALMAHRSGDATWTAIRPPLRPMAPADAARLVRIMAAEGVVPPVE